MRALTAAISQTCGGPRWPPTTVELGAPGPAVPNACRAGRRPAVSAL